MSRYSLGGKHTGQWHWCWLSFIVKDVMLRQVHFFAILPWLEGGEKSNAKGEYGCEEGLRPYEELAGVFSTRNVHSPTSSCSSENHSGTAGCLLSCAELWLSLVRMCFGNLCLASSAVSPVYSAALLDLLLALFGLLLL